ncbi:MAG: Gfo/Idh/MocA family oxidoreductase [Blastocatellia bacterium]
MTASQKKSKTGAQGGRKVRYAVVGEGYISQAAVLPAFSHANKNSELAALVSGDPVKLKKLGKQYNVPYTYSYEEYDRCLKSGEVDAVYIALPNNMHREYTVRAARAGIHVLCEKPMAVTERECEEMIRACDDNNVKLMIAYRLHFEEANMKAVEVVRSGKIGEPRIFNSVFTQQVAAGNIRLQSDLGGGTLYDIGIYCLNAARYLFRAEPIEATAHTASSGEQRFSEVEEMVSVMLRFPEDRLATFTCSFGSASANSYQIVGTKGDLRVAPAYELADELKHQLTINGKTKERTFAKRDQFAPELLYFSDCIINDRKPEPSGLEGLIDVAIIRALYRSARTGKTVKLEGFGRKRRPTIAQEKKRPAVEEPELVHAEPPSGER